jgi:LysM domain-containing protein
VFSLKPVSIFKIVASASVLVPAFGAALFFALAHVGDEDGLATDAVAPTTSAGQTRPAVREDFSSEGPDTLPEPAATGAPTALAAAETAPAAIAAQLAGPPEANDKEQFSTSFDIVRIEENGDAVVAGRAPPGATVDLMRGEESLDRAVADASGEFAMIPHSLPAGSYELTLRSNSPDGTSTWSKHGARVTINHAGSGAVAGQFRTDAPQTAPQPRLLSEPDPQTGRPQKNAAPRPEHSVPASSELDESASSSAVGHSIPSKVISRGDSLWRISRMTYGDGSRFALVYRANRNRIRDPNLIFPGQTLVLPAKRD